MKRLKDGQFTLTSLAETEAADDALVEATYGHGTPADLRSRGYRFLTHPPDNFRQHRVEPRSRTEFIPVVLPTEDAVLVRRAIVSMLTNPYAHTLRALSARNNGRINMNQYPEVAKDTSADRMRGIALLDAMDKVGVPTVEVSDDVSTLMESPDGPSMEDREVA